MGGEPLPTPDGAPSRAAACDEFSSRPFEGGIVLAGAAGESERSEAMKESNEVQCGNSHERKKIIAPPLKQEMGQGR